MVTGRKITPVILSGGVGARLWPLSRAAKPKQFHEIVGEDTLFAQTLSRFRSDEYEKPLIICNQQHRFLVAETLLRLEIEADIILEPVAKNTAAAIALATNYLIAKRDNTLALVMPCDHVIGDLQAFHESVDTGVDAAMSGQIVTLGIKPDRAETGFGYILMGSDDDSDNVYRVEQFVEKPNLEKAQEFLANGRYLWNSGLFLFPTEKMQAELQRFQPQLADCCQKAIAHPTSDLDFIRVDEEEFSRAPSISFDYAVMEKTDSAVVIPVDCQWNDVGSWRAVKELETPDGNGNVLGERAVSLNSKNCFVHSEKLLVALSSVENVSVIATDDVVLVCDQDHTQDVKNIVERLSKENWPQASQHKRVHRPWGWYETMDMGPGFKVKQIFVNPGEGLSLQRHQKRSEHWVVISGQAHILCDGKKTVLNSNESTFVPVGVTHRIQNKGLVSLIVIEVQTGQYLEEDDIERLDERHAYANQIG